MRPGSNGAAQQGGKKHPPDSARREANLTIQGKPDERKAAIPLGIAGWLRYMLAVDDEGRDYELAPDPMNEELQEQLGDIVVGKPETLKDQLKPVLSNERLFFTDLYKARVGEKVEEMFREMIAGKGAVKATLHKYIQK